MHSQHALPFDPLFPGLQQMAQVLAGSSLALLLVRLLQCKQLDRAADRGFKGRPCSIRSSSHSNTTRSCQNTAAAGGQCHVLYPWSDDRLDLQLGLLLMLMSGCGNDADNYKDFGLEAVTQQVGSAGWLAYCSASCWVCLLINSPAVEILISCVLHTTNKSSPCFWYTWCCMRLPARSITTFSCVR